MKTALESFNIIAINVLYIDRIEENAFSQYDFYSHALAQEPLLRGSYNFGKPLLDHHYVLLELSDLCQGVKKKIFKEMMPFQYMTYLVTP